MWPGAPMAMITGLHLHCRKREYCAAPFKLNLMCQLITEFIFHSFTLTFNLITGFSFYSPLGNERVSGRFNYLSGRYCCLTTHVPGPDSVCLLFPALFFLIISQLPTLSLTTVRY